MPNPSSRDDLRRLQEHFDAAVELNAEQRGAYLDRVLSDDPVTREAVERMLRAADEVATGFLDEAVSGAARDLAGSDDRRGSQLGPYRLLNELGRGGMGTVWLAERADEAYSARVAIKLVRGGFANPELERRFRAERQILADLRHPNIARLLDGGTAPDGTPFLVMEYVEGAPITQYAATKTLGVRERLALFRRVCDAVQHAHASLVVHRDIKPSNILVGGDGVPKLMDFGIAKPLVPEAGAETTALLRPMTPAYASPEQIRGERITVATDVYALGILLYELLTEVQPFATPGASTIDVQRRVLEDEPRAPSAVVAGRPQDAPATAKELAGDLDNIVARAIAKETDRRYGSVAQLADDVRRHLDGEPVTARAPTMTYRLGKFMRRRRVEVTVAATAVLLLTGFSVYYTASLARERDIANMERELADRERQTAEQVSDFLANMFWSADPAQALGDTVTARDLLARGRERLDTALANAPNVRARMLATLGSVHYNLAQYNDARSLLERAIALMDSTEAATISLVAQDQDARNSTLSRSAQRASAEQTIQPLRTLAAVLSTLGERDSALVVGERSVVSAREAADSTQLAQRGLAIMERAMPPESAPLESPLFQLGTTLYQLERYREALEYLRRARIVVERNHPVNSPRFVRIFSALGSTYDQLGDTEPALDLLTRAVQIQEVATGPDHPDITYPLNNLAAFHIRHENFAEAVRLFERSVPIMEQGRAGDLPEILPQYAQALRGIGDDQKAAEIEQRVGEAR